MARKTITILTVKKALAKAFPDVDFCYGTAGRGHMRGHSVSWTGGPSESEVTAHVPGGVAQWGYGCYESALMHVNRIMTADEYAVYSAEQDARYDAECAKRAAEAPARKAAGVAKAKETREWKKEVSATLIKFFPDTTFTIEKAKWGGYRIVWQDGPSRTDVQFRLSDPSRPEVSLLRTESPAARVQAAERAQVHVMVARTARRLAASKARQLVVSKAIAKRRRALAQLTFWALFDGAPSPAAANSNCDKTVTLRSLAA